ncbi:hypothetical protein [Streptomyces fuscigenes]|uniref:hypothetical protein n=1 Tax=Streptomyces fuscigenes TaxID=1528880 RepID=UPI001F168947|nr:hypothetical protein [Streptomyces fuscigenes]MCF3960295.1 hypothetical protein [Streptomyces fuscigenes]
MGHLPRTIPEAALQELRAVLAAAGITLGPLVPGKGVTHSAEHRGATWRLAYMGRAYGWAVFGPGVDHGVAVALEDIPGLMNAPAEPEQPTGPTDWAVRHPDGRLWTCADQQAAEEVNAEAPHMTAVYRTPGGQWQEWRTDRATAHTTGAPRTHLGVPVPELVREAWATHLGEGWRLGIRSALAR